MVKRWRSRAAIACAAWLCVSGAAWAADDKKDESPLNSGTFSGMKLRNIGPALMSGRIADIAVHPGKPNTWYVGVGSGGVWKTTNAGTTWQPLFDGQTAYSIGAVTLDPSNPHTVWVGTGENVGGRHVGYGDGLYRSQDGGASWKNMGLKDSEHISKIIVHPKDSNTLWVAAQGPLWSQGGERGLYKSSDGGENWNLVLSEGPWTGVTDVVIDPRNPDVLYAATWQRHRSVAAYMGGGPESGLHRSMDGGETWEKLTSGLPTGNLGKIGLAISPQNPDVVYAAIELNRREGGVWRSADRGSSWAKMSDTVSGATGPHYYQELYASPHAFDRLYLMDVRVQVSDDGGKTFRQLQEEHKHSDNHALAFRPDDPDYLLIGTDGGLYETFDLAQSWRFVDNLPITQFYKVAVDDAEPFYTVYGGTQDNNTQGGPSRTDNRHGIRNADWFITLFGDGHQPAVEPGNPDIMYSEWQGGNLVRVDRTTGEIVYIQPQEEPGEDPQRFNWDSPILVSPHQPTRLYYASQRVWRSDDRGDSWRAVSGDLTRNQERLQLELMGRKWSWDAPWDTYAMSQYNTITSLAESPVTEGILYAGTDDGLIQVSENGGESWRSIEVGKLPDVPATAFVNDIKADLFDADTVYVALDNHKFGDYQPYLLRSTDRGRSWRNMGGDLPERHLVWRLVQDHVNPELFFAGTEFGVFFTVDAGKKWVKLTGDAPTISFRDLAIQRRENDLVGATFGRGFWILDDYTPLRGVSAESLEQEALLFDPRKAWWYIPRASLGFGEKASQGGGYYTAPNPPFGAVFTYYLKDSLTTSQEDRQKSEQALIDEDKDTPAISWDEIEAERREAKPVVVLTVRDSDGNVVRRIEGPAKAGMHRVDWDLSYPSIEAIGSGGGFFGDDSGSGYLAAPGRYTVELAKRVNGVVSPLADAVGFDVEPLRKGALPGATPDQVVAFWKRLASMQRATSAASATLGAAAERLGHLQTAMNRTVVVPGELDAEWQRLRQALYDIEYQINGDSAKEALNEPSSTISGRLGVAAIGTGLSTYGPTPTHRRSLEIVEEQWGTLSARLNRLVQEEIPAFEEKLRDVGAPWTPGQPVPSK